MKVYEINKEEYTELKNNKKKFKNNYELQDGDRLYIFSKCKINIYYLDEYLENNYDDVCVIKDIHNSNVIIANENNFNYTVDIGYKYQDLMFRNEEQWKVYISRMKGRPDYSVPQEEVPQLSEAYNKPQVGITINEKDAVPIYYVQVYDDDLTVELIREYNNNILKVVDETILINRIDETIDNSQYELTDISSIQSLIKSAKSNIDIDAVILSINKLHRDVIVTRILPYYYCDNISSKLKEKLYEDVFMKIKNVKNIILIPRKASYSFHDSCVENIKRIQKKTKLELDKSTLIKCFLNE